jgi:hypothetical protein
MQHLSAVKPLMARNSKGTHLTIASAKSIDLGHRTYIANLSKARKVMHVLCTSYTECIVSLIIVDRDHLLKINKVTCHSFMVHVCILINLKGTQS